MSRRPLLNLCHASRSRLASARYCLPGRCAVPMPETPYALSGDVHVAFQVMGEGSVNVVYIPGWVSHLELEMENGLPRRFYEALARFTRLIRFDKRGTGMSDPVMGDVVEGADRRHPRRTRCGGRRAGIAVRVFRGRHDGGGLRCPASRAGRQACPVRQPRRKGVGQPRLSVWLRG
jgi:pimeloyl-ACP methyl ester carboxylesterase